ncbi:MAG: hypothetical protein ACHQAX_00430 [Gammaproteobacteria bacterium]
MPKGQNPDNNLEELNSLDAGRVHALAKELQGATSIQFYTTHRTKTTFTPAEKLYAHEEFISRVEIEFEIQRGTRPIEDYGIIFDDFGGVKRRPQSIIDVAQDPATKSIDISYQADKNVRVPNHAEWVTFFRGPNDWTNDFTDRLQNGPPGTNLPGRGADFEIVVEEDAGKSIIFKARQISTNVITELSAAEVKGLAGLVTYAIQAYMRDFAPTSAPCIYTHPAHDPTLLQRAIDKVKEGITPLPKETTKEKIQTGVSQAVGAVTSTIAVGIDKVTPSDLSKAKAKQTISEFQRALLKAAPEAGTLRQMSRNARAAKRAAQQGIGAGLSATGSAAATVAHHVVQAINPEPLYDLHKKQTKLQIARHNNELERQAQATKTLAEHQEKDWDELHQDQFAEMDKFVNDREQLLQAELEILDIKQANDMRELQRNHAQVRESILKSDPLCKLTSTQNLIRLCVQTQTAEQNKRRADQTVVRNAAINEHHAQDKIGLDQLNQKQTDERKALETQQSTDRQQFNNNRDELFNRQIDEQKQLHATQQTQLQARIELFAEPKFLNLEQVQARQRITLQSVHQKRQHGINEKRLKLNHNVHVAIGPHSHELHLNELTLMKYEARSVALADQLRQSKREGNRLGRQIIKLNKLQAQHALNVANNGRLQTSIPDALPHEAEIKTLQAQLGVLQIKINLLGPEFANLKQEIDKLKIDINSSKDNIRAENAKSDATLGTPGAIESEQIQLNDDIDVENKKLNILHNEQKEIQLDLFNNRKDLEDVQHIEMSNLVTQQNKADNQLSLKIGKAKSNLAGTPEEQHRHELALLKDEQQQALNQVMHQLSRYALEMQHIIKQQERLQEQSTDPRLAPVPVAIDPAKAWLDSMKNENLNQQREHLNAERAKLDSIITKLKTAIEQQVTGIKTLIEKHAAELVERQNKFHDVELSALKQLATEPVGNALKDLQTMQTMLLEQDLQNERHKYESLKLSIALLEHDIFTLQELLRQGRLLERPTRSFSASLERLENDIATLEKDLTTDRPRLRTMEILVQQHDTQRKTLADLHSAQAEIQKVQQKDRDDQKASHKRQDEKLIAGQTIASKNAENVVNKAKQALPSTQLTGIPLLTEFHRLEYFLFVAQQDLTLTLLNQKIQILKQSRIQKHDQLQLKQQQFISLEGQKRPISQNQPNPFDEALNDQLDLQIRELVALTSEDTRELESLDKEIENAEQEFQTLQEQQQADMVTLTNKQHTEIADATKLELDLAATTAVHGQAMLIMNNQHVAEVGKLNNNITDTEAGINALEPEKNQLLSTVELKSLHDRKTELLNLKHKRESVLLENQCNVFVKDIKYLNTLQEHKELYLALISQQASPFRKAYIQTLEADVEKTKKDIDRKTDEHDQNVKEIEELVKKHKTALAELKVKQEAELNRIEIAITGIKNVFSDILKGTEERSATEALAPYAKVLIASTDQLDEKTKLRIDHFILCASNASMIALNFDKDLLEKYIGILKVFDPLFTDRPNIIYDELNPNFLIALAFNQFNRFKPIKPDSYDEVELQERKTELQLRKDVLEKHIQDYLEMIQPSNQGLNGRFAHILNSLLTRRRPLDVHAMVEEIFNVIENDQRHRLVKSNSNRKLITTTDRLVMASKDYQFTSIDYDMDSNNIDKRKALTAVKIRKLTGNKDAFPENKKYQGIYVILCNHMSAKFEEDQNKAIIQIEKACVGPTGHIINPDDVKKRILDAARKCIESKTMDEASERLVTQLVLEVSPNSSWAEPPKVSKEDVMNAFIRMKLAENRNDADFARFKCEYDASKMKYDQDKNLPPNSTFDNADDKKIDDIVHFGREAKYFDISVDVYDEAIKKIKAEPVGSAPEKTLNLHDWFGDSPERLVEKLEEVLRKDRDNPDTLNQLPENRRIDWSINNNKGMKP